MRHLLFGLALFWTSSAFAASEPPLVIKNGQTQQLPATDTLQLPNITGSTQCVHADTTGAITGTGSDCGSGGGGSVSVTAGTPNTVITPSPGTGTFTVGTTTPLNAQTGTSYTVLTGDNTKLITISNTSAVAVTLPQAGSAGFASGWSGCFTNLNTGLVTITTTTSTINGNGQTLILPQGASACLASDGTNWQGTISSLKIPGTSGGVPYYAATNELLSSGALTANLPVFGGGAGAAPIVGTRSGNTTEVATVTGSLTSGNCIKSDASGNLVDAATTCGGGGGGGGANLPVGTTLTGAGALTIGQMIPVNLTSANATLTLADGSSDGQLVGILVLDTNTKLVTIDPAGTTKIDGALTRIMWAQEVAILRWDATAAMWRKVGGKSIPMEAVMYLASTTANTVDSTETDVPLDTSSIDNTGLMVNTGANKITIQRGGTYIVSENVNFLPGTSSAATNAQGAATDASNSNVKLVRNIGGWFGPVLVSLPASQLVTLTAAHDIRLRYYQNTGGTTTTINGGVDVTFLSITEVPTW